MKTTPDVHVPDAPKLGTGDRAFWRHVFAGLALAARRACPHHCEDAIEGSVADADALLAALGWDEEDGDA